MTDKPLEHKRICHQDYANGRWIETGIVRGHKVDTVYLALGEAPNLETLRVLFAWDEIATLTWALGGALYSAMMDLPDGDDVNRRLRALGESEPNDGHTT